MIIFVCVSMCVCLCNSCEVSGIFVRYQSGPSSLCVVTVILPACFLPVDIIVDDCLEKKTSIARKKHHLLKFCLICIEALFRACAGRHWGGNHFLRGSTFFGCISGKKLAIFMSCRTKGSKNLRKLRFIPINWKVPVTTTRFQQEKAVCKGLFQKGGVIVESQSHSVIFAKW